MRGRRSGNSGVERAGGLDTLGLELRLRFGVWKEEGDTYEDMDQSLLSQSWASK